MRSADLGSQSKAGPNSKTSTPLVGMNAAPKTPPRPGRYLATRGTDSTPFNLGLAARATMLNSLMYVCPFASPQTTPLLTNIADETMLDHI
jgi:hypothetical protein